MRRPFLLSALFLLLATCYGLAQLPGTFLPPGTSIGGAVGCTPNTGGGGTFANTKALYHFDNDLVDSSGKGHNGTAGGGITLSNVQSKFGGFSLLGGNGKYVTVTASADFIFAGDFTFEFFSFLNNATYSSYSPVWANYNSSFGSVSFGPQRSFIPSSNAPTINLGPSATSGTAYSWTRTSVANVWEHYAFVRSGSNVDLYVNGTKLAGTNTVSGSVGDSSNTIRIADYGNLSSGWQGYLDEIRVSNVARYTANFTPPAAAFCNN